MTTKRLLPACAILALAFLVSPANAGHDRHAGGRCYRQGGHGCYWRIQHIIHRKENLIAFLEAEPDFADAFKAPAITRLQAKIQRLRALIRPRWPVWPNPCCYSRTPLHIR
jgi:hypothetical protein